MSGDDNGKLVDLRRRELAALESEMRFDRIARLVLLLSGAISAAVLGLATIDAFVLASRQGHEEVMTLRDVELEAALAASETTQRVVQAQELERLLEHERTRRGDPVGEWTARDREFAAHLECPGHCVGDPTIIEPSEVVVVPATEAPTSLSIVVDHVGSAVGAVRRRWSWWTVLAILLVIGFWSNFQEVVGAIRRAARWLTATALRAMRHRARQATTVEVGAGVTPSPPSMRGTGDTDTVPLPTQALPASEARKREEGDDGA